MTGLAAITTKLDFVIASLGERAIGGHRQGPPFNDLLVKWLVSYVVNLPFQTWAYRDSLVTAGDP